MWKRPIHLNHHLPHTRLCIIRKLESETELGPKPRHSRMGMRAFQRMYSLHHPMLGTELGVFKIVSILFQKIKSVIFYNSLTDKNVHIMEQYVLFESCIYLCQYMINTFSSDIQHFHGENTQIQFSSCFHR